MILNIKNNIPTASTSWALEKCSLLLSDNDHYLIKSGSVPLSYTRDFFPPVGVYEVVRPCGPLTRPLI